MVKLEQIRAGGLRAYELGRLRAASRVALLLVPLSVICAFETGAKETCACLGVVLLGIVVFLRWRNRIGTQTAATGLVAGSFPLLVGLVVARAVPNCVDAPVLSMCTPICLAAGVTSGLWIGVRVMRRRAGLSSVVTAAGIAALAASLGCIGLGVAASVGAGVGLLAGSVAGALTKSLARG